MSFRLTRLSALDGEAILPLAACKAHLRVDVSTEDDLIGALRDAAIDYVEQQSGVALAPTQYRWSMPCFEARIDLPAQPATAIDAVAYTDSDGASATYADAQLINGNALPAIGGSWPASNGYAAIDFTAGLSDPAEAPLLLAAVKLMLGSLYDNRSAVSTGQNAPLEVPLGVTALINTCRRMLV